MKMVSNSNWNRTNVQMVSLACGLALAAVAIVGGNEVLRDKDSAVIISPAALQPQFATASDADYASLGLAYLRSAQVTSESLVGPAEALGIGQPGEGTKSVEATFIDPTDFASSFANHSAAQQFGTAADAAYATESWQARASEAPLFGTMVDAVYVMEGEIQLP
jgi:hypothetical protein